MREIFIALIYKLKHILRIVWPTVIVAFTLLFVSLIFPRYIRGSSYAQSIKHVHGKFIILNPALALCIVIACGAIFMSIDLLFQKTRLGAGSRKRYTMRGVLTEDDIYLLYQSPLSARSIIFLTLIVNTIVTSIAFIPLAILIALSFTDVYGIEVIRYVVFSYIFLILAYIHGYSLYLTLIAPRGVENVNTWKTTYFTLLALTCLGPLILKYAPYLYFISPSATYALAIDSIARFKYSNAIPLALIYTLIPLVILDKLSNVDYSIKPLDLIYGTLYRVEYAGIRIFNISTFIDNIVKRLPSIYIAYASSIAIGIPIILKILNIPNSIINIVTISLFYIVIIMIVMLPVNLSYIIGIILGMCGWFINQSTYPIDKILTTSTIKILKYSLIPMIIAIVLSILNILITGNTLMYRMLLMFVIFSIVLSIPALKLIIKLALAQGLKNYLKSGNLPLAIDYTNISAAEEMRDRIIILIPFIVIIIGILIMSYGISTILENIHTFTINTLIGFTILIIGVIVYSILLIIMKILVDRFTKI